MSTFQNTETDQVDQLTVRLASLEHEVQELKRVLRQSQPDLPAPPQGTANAKISSFVRMTQELFLDSTLEIDIEADPAEPEFEFVVVKVRCRGELNEILAKEMEWNRRIGESEPGDSERIRLLVIPSNS